MLVITHKATAIAVHKLAPQGGAVTGWESWVQHQVDLHQLMADRRPSTGKEEEVPHRQWQDALIAAGSCICICPLLAHGRHLLQAVSGQHASSAAEAKFRCGGRH